MSEKLFDNNYNATELTKISINVNEVFASKDDELHHIRLQCHEFMFKQGYDESVFTKYRHKKQLSHNATNKIFLSVRENFGDMLSLVDIFSVICDYFGVDEVEFYNQLSLKIQNLLKMELVRTTSFTKKDLFYQKTNDGKFMPSL